MARPSPLRPPGRPPGQYRSRSAGRGSPLRRYTRPAIRYVRKLALGAPDEADRLWLREDEAQEIVTRASKGYTPTFFIKEGVWRSSRGYFRLFTHKGGSNGLVFAFSYDALEVEEYKDDSFPHGIRYVLKNPKAEVYLAKIWPPGTHPKLSDIDRAIDNYTDAMRRAILTESVLFETDQEKGVFRSGGVAYMLRFADSDDETHQLKRVVGEVSLYTKTMRNGTLVNPFGENILERFLLGFDAGVGLFSLLARQSAEAVNTNEELRNRRKTAASRGRFPHSRSREDAEILLFRDHHRKTLRYLRNQDPITPDEQKLNRAYYATKYLLRVGIAFVKQGQYYFRLLSLDNAAGGRSFIMSLASALRGYLVGGVLLVVIPVFTAGLTAVGFFKPKAIDPNILLDRKDPLVLKFSKTAHRIEAFQTLERPLRNETFEQATMLMQPTFDRAPPRGVKSEAGFDQWPLDLLETSLQERGRSIIRFYYDRTARPSAHPVKDVRAFKILRHDGIVTIKFINEDIVWGLYAGEPFISDAHSPPQALIDILKSGYVVQINNRLDAAERETMVPLSDAEKLFEEKFGMPLLEKGMSRSCLVVPSQPDNPGIKDLKAAFKEAADETLEGMRQAAPDVSPTSSRNKSPRDKAIDRIIHHHDVLIEEKERCEIIRPFVATMLPAISLLADKRLKYEFFVMNSGTHRSVQLHCTISNDEYICLMTRSGHDLFAVDQGRIIPLDVGNELILYVRKKLEYLPSMPPTLLRRLWPAGSR
jgi:hypothetical protein